MLFMKEVTQWSDTLRVTRLPHSAAILNVHITLVPPPLFRVKSVEAKLTAL